MPDTPKKIVITDCYALNSGDVGILMAMVAELRRVMSDIGITIESTHPDALRRFEEFRDCDIVPRVFNIEDYDYAISRWLKMVIVIRGIYDSISFLLWAALVRCGVTLNIIIRPSRRSQAMTLKSADAIVSVGGGFLSSLYNYHFRIYVFLLARLLRRPMVVFAQSIGPFGTRLSRFLIPLCLNHCAMITIREPNSFDYVRNNGVKNGCRQTADAAFLLEPKSAAWADDLLGDGSAVAIGLKHYDDPTKALAFREAVMAAVHHLAGRGYLIVLTNHVRETEPMSDDIVERFEGAVKQVRFGVNPRELKYLYSRCAFVVSGIMHPTIFAAESGVPFVAIGYESKFDGLVDMLGYDRRFLLDGNRLLAPDFVESLLSVIDLVVSERARVAEELRKKMPDIVELARTNFTLLDRTLGAESADRKND